jgi:uncharacterized membrane protein
MPFTPFHIGFAVLVYALFPFLDPIALVLGTILIDSEGIFYLLTEIGSLHGPMHSVLGVLVLFIPITVISWGSFKLLGKMTNREYPFNWWWSLLSGFVALISHVIFDAGLYGEMMLFYPFTKETGYLYGFWDNTTAIITLVAMFALGAIIIAVRILVKQKKKKEEKEGEEKTEEKEERVEESITLENKEDEELQSEKEEEEKIEEASERIEDQAGGNSN